MRTPSLPTWKWSKLSRLQDMQMLLAPCLLCLQGGEGGVVLRAGSPELFLTCKGLWVEPPRLTFLR